MKLLIIGFWLTLFLGEDTAHYQFSTPTLDASDSSLVSLIISVAESDVKYRRGSIPNWYAKQKPLDAKNQSIIDSLYEVHQTYVGRSLVGDKYEYVMWSVIQHSNLETMEKYLPVLAKAVKEEELGLIPFKMLLDRYHGLKFGYQIYGTQRGFDFGRADEETKQEIERKYGIER